jgi:hypothetical protein
MLFLFFARSIAIFLCQVRISISVSFSLSHTQLILSWIFSVFLCSGLNLQLEADLGEKLSPPLKQYIQDLLKVSLFVVLLLIYVNSNLDLCVQLGFNCYFQIVEVCSQLCKISFSIAPPTLFFMVKKLKELLLCFNSYYDS